MKRKLNQTGITLVALVITIIILLILAGITISQLTESGLFDKARQAKQKSENAQIKEETTLADYENEIGEYVEGSRDTVTISKEEYEQLKTDVETLKGKSKKFIDFKRVLKSINTQGASWTATEDCAIIIQLYAKNAYAAIVYVDGVEVSRIQNQNSTSSSHTGITNVVYVEKGSEITTRADYGQYYLTAYGLK